MLKVQVPGRHAFVENKWLALAPACFFQPCYTKKLYEPGTPLKAQVRIVTYSMKFLYDGLVQ